MSSAEAVLAVRTRTASASRSRSGILYSLRAHAVRPPLPTPIDGGFETHDPSVGIVEPTGSSKFDGAFTLVSEPFAETRATEG